MTLLAAFAVLLARFSRQDDIVVGTPIANRTHIATEPLIGLFINTLPVRVALAANPSFAALLAQVREVALGAYAHQALPFDKLVEALQPDRTSSYPPLFQVIFDLHNTPAAELHLGSVQATRLPLARTVAKVDLSLILRTQPTVCWASLNTTPTCSTPRPSRAWLPAGWCC